VSVIQINGEFPDLTDKGGGNTVTIYPERTSMGDLYLPDTPQWEFGGIENITPSSISDIPIPMLNKILIFI
jgi:hypothetical protein